MMVIVVGVLVGGVAYYAMQLEGEAEKEYVQRKFKEEARQIRNHIHIVLSNPKNCIATLKPTINLGQITIEHWIATTPTVPFNFNPSEIRYIDRRGASPAIETLYEKAGATGMPKYGNSNIQIEDFLMTENDYTTTFTKTSGDIGRLVFKVKNKGLLKGTNGPEEYVQSIRMWVDWKDDGSGANQELRSCRALADDTNQIWSIDPANANNIHYGNTAETPTPKTYNVGINNDVPSVNPGNATYPPPSAAPFHFVIGNLNDPGHNPHGTDPSDIENQKLGTVLSEDDAMSPAFTYFSDERLKDNIQPIVDPLEVIMNIRGVEYDWVESGEHDFGLIAQEVEDYLPELVKTHPKTGLKKVDYGKVIPFLVEVFKRQQYQLKRLKQELETKK